MRFILGIILFIFSLNVIAHEVKCYSAGKLVYKHKVEDIRFYENQTMFDESNSDKSVITNLDCLVKID